MFALSRRRRNAVAAAGIGAFAAAFALLPTQAGSRLARTMALPPPQRETIAALPAAVAPARDPFAPRIDESPEPPLPPRRLPDLAHLVPLPPNAGAGPFPFGAAQPQRTRLIAVVTGPQPRAVVDENGTSRLLAVGARLEGARIASVDRDGVRLDDGRRILLSVTEELNR